jgi:Sulfotransferase family
VWDRGGGPEDAVFIAGSGRSGTTWVEEIANADHSARIVFEPFRVKEVPQVRGLAEYTYLRPDDERYVDVVGAVLSGYPRHNRWINHQNYTHVAHRRIVKEIRAHGWLGWMRRRFPQTPLIFLIRHPVMVIASQQRMGWKDHLGRLLEQPELVADHLQPHLGVLESLETPWQRMVGHWCVDNLVAFRTVGAALGTLVMYEEFVIDHKRASQPLLQALGRSMDAATVAEAVARPSKMARHDSAVRHGGDSLNDPFSRVPAAQRREALEIVSALGFGDIYGDDPLPDFDAARRLWGKGPSGPSPTTE